VAVQEIQHPAEQAAQEQQILEVEARAVLAVAVLVAQAVAAL
jgi:hypothetical protein